MKKSKKTEEKVIYLIAGQNGKVEIHESPALGGLKLKLSDGDVHVYEMFGKNLANIFAQAGFDLYKHLLAKQRAARSSSTMPVAQVETAK